jgi:hypothetical protein
MPLIEAMKQNARSRSQNVRTFLWLSAVAAVGVSGWACSSGSQDNAGAGASGNSGAASAQGGRVGTGGASAAGRANGSGADSGSGVGGDENPGAGGDENTGAGGTSNAGTSSTGGSSTAGTSSTGSTACDNGKDDDGDGLTDGFDPECSGPLDDDEGSFATGIPGDNSDPKWQDCFFDGNSGAGDDDCRYSTKCLTGELPQSDPDCTVTDACIKNCARLSQNGCDCFGCCTVQLPSGSTIDVAEVSSCSLAALGDEKACPRCTKSTQCGNECGECELCAGKTLADLPSHCSSPPPGTGGSSGTGGASGTTGGSKSTGGTSAGGTPGTGGMTATGGTGVGYTCDGGEQVCGPGLGACSAVEYCSLGCCLPAVR